MKTVFIDRDGVINRNRREHVKSWSEFVFLPRAAEALAELTRWGFRIVILTNQAVINRGIVSQEVIDEIHTRMVAHLENTGARIDGVFCCPHRPEEQCSCRKPQPGLLFSAAERLGIDLTESYLIGDAISDIRAGKSAGCRTILVLTGRGPRQLLSREARVTEGYSVSRTIWHAVRRILVEEKLVEAEPLETIVAGTQRSVAQPVVQQLSRLFWSSNPNTGP